MHTNKHYFSLGGLKWNGCNYRLFFNSGFVDSQAALWSAYLSGLCGGFGLAALPGGAQSLQTLMNCPQINGFPVVGGVSNMSHFSNWNSNLMPTTLPPVGVPLSQQTSKGKRKSSQCLGPLSMDMYTKKGRRSKDGSRVGTANG